MKKQKKKEIITELKKRIEGSTVTILADYRGMTVKDITALKKKLYEKGAEFKVVKNSLSERAFVAEQFAALKSLLSGPVAILMGFEDPIGPIKVLAKFISENEKPMIKGGVFEGKITTVEEITAISKLPSKEELLAKVVFRVKSPLVGLVFVLKNTIAKLVYALQAVKDKKGKEEGGERK